MMDEFNENQEKENSSGTFIGDAIVDGVFEVPLEIGKAIVDKIKESDIPEALMSAKDVVADHLASVPEGLSDVVKGAAEGLVDVAGDVLGGIDL